MELRRRPKAATLTTTRWPSPQETSTAHRQPPVQRVPLALPRSVRQPRSRGQLSSALATAAAVEGPPVSVARCPRLFAKVATALGRRGLDSLSGACVMAADDWRRLCAAVAMAATASAQRTSRASLVVWAVPRSVPFWAAPPPPRARRRSRDLPPARGPTASIHRHPRHCANTGHERSRRAAWRRRPDAQPSPCSAWALLRATICHATCLSRPPTLPQQPTPSQLHFRRSRWTGLCLLPRQRHDHRPQRMNPQHSVAPRPGPCCRRLGCGFVLGSSRPIMARCRRPLHGFTRAIAAPKQRLGRSNAAENRNGGRLGHAAAAEG